MRTLNWAPFFSTGRWLGAAFGLVLFGAFALQSGFVSTNLDSETQAATPRLQARTLQSSLAFVPNQGQSHPSVLYQAHGWADGMLYFEPEGVALAIPDDRPFSSVERPTKAGLSDLQPALSGSVSAIGLRFIDANPTVQIQAGSRQIGHFNYLLGNESADWQTKVPSYESLRYIDLYPGIHLQYDGQSGHLKGDWLVAPGADPSQIAWQYEGVDKIEVDVQSGDLIMQLPADESGPRTMIEAAPVAWQMPAPTDARRAGLVDDLYNLSYDLPHELPNGADPVEVAFVLKAQGRIGFDVGAYDTGRPLIIDPQITFASYLGGAARDWGYDIELDDQNNIYVGGGTASIDFPLESPLQAARGRTSHGFFLADAFISKLSPDGQQLLFSTYLGGNEGGDVGQSLAVDANGRIAITGETHAADFPTKNAFQANKVGNPILPSPGEGAGFDGYVAQISADGSQLLFGTFYGGDGREEPQSIAYGPNDDLYITGHTLAADIPLKNAVQANYGGGHEGFVARIDGQSYELKWSTYIGGSKSDMGWGLAVDPGGAVYVAGSTSSLDFPVANAVQPAIASSPRRTQESDMFLARISADGQTMVFSTYMGGIGEDRAISVAVDSRGQAVFTGMSGNPGDFPLVQPIQSNYEGRARNGVVLKIDPSGQNVEYATFLGDTGDDWGVDVDIDGNDNAWVVGRTTSAEFPVKDPVQNLHAGANDAFVAALSPDGQTLIFSTWVGGSQHDMGMGMAVRPDGAAHITGWTGSLDYPLVKPIQAVAAGGNDAYIAQIGGVDLPDPPSSEPTPTPRDTGDCICSVVRLRVPAAVISKAVANPDSISGWGQALDPSKPVSPVNPLRECLSLRNESQDYHPLFNTTIWKVGCR